MSSFLGVHRLSEYFSNTTAFVGGHLKYIRSVETNGAGKKGTRVTVYTRDGVNGAVPDEYAFYAHTYEDGLEHIKPFLPKTQYFLNSEGKSWLCAYSPVQNWKRSLCHPRYISRVPLAPIFGGGISDCLRYPVDFQKVVPRRVKDVMSCAELDSVTALDRNFALYEGDRAKVPLILYQTFPIATVDDWGTIKPHPRYHKFFGERLRNLGEVCNEN